MDGVCNLITSLFVIIVIVGATVNADGFLGCGGFVKSDVDINYSLVEIRLYTAHGSIKYSTDCAPNNGYYLIPVYDKGDFVLKVEPPVGWSFEPSSIELHIDGTSDRCSKGEDINFVFTGFSLYGQVISSGQSVGPADVDVRLYKNGHTEVISAVRSGEHGKYSFFKLLPGDYDIKANHPAWVFDKDVTKVSIGRDNSNADGGLIVRGYPVSGVVYSEQEPIRGVKFVLFSQLPSTAATISGCDSTNVPGFSSNEKHSPLCHVVSSDKGVFHFPVLPTGGYVIVPFYKGEHIMFDVLPERMQFSVSHGSVNLPQAFEVAGFSVSGKVLDSVNGRGIVGAKVLINNKEQGVTKSGGLYHLENMKTGLYTIDVVAKHMKFESSSIKITPNTPYLPDVITHSFRVCGKVRIDRLPESVRSHTTRSVTITDSRSKVVTVETDSEDSFCTHLRPASYIIKAVVSEREGEAGLCIIPSQQTIDVTTAPLSGIKFTQFRASLTGVVQCFEKCGHIEISIESVGRGDTKLHTKVTDAEKGGTFTFKDLLPGKYTAVLLHDMWCWKHKSLDAEIIDSDVAVVPFTQTGYIFKCSLSHEITLHFTHEKKAGTVGSFKLNKGTNRFCLAQSGVYRLTPDSCHRFDQEVYSYDTSKPSTLSLTAVRHIISGEVKSDTNHADITVQIKSSLEGETVTLGPLSVSSKTDDNGPFVYNFTYWAKTGDSLQLTAHSHKLLFYPKDIMVNIPGDKCAGMVATFDTKEGVFISGEVLPALGGVKVIITPSSATLNEIVLQTDTGGKYSVGPLNPELQYTVSAEKAGYTLEKVKGHVGVFKAFKLAEINVKVWDEEKMPLASVLLSLSGGSDYRSNNLTPQTGILTFMSLNPGQYYLRAMMKEYRFEPSSQMIEVTEGSTTDISIQGVRVAFSCFGHVTSLNGEPESSIVVEAVGQGGCGGHQEESKTEADGAFRIRGLQPDCEYTVRLHTSPINPHIERTTPTHLDVRATRDIHDLHFIAFRRTNQLDVSGNVVTAQENLSTLKVRLYREDNPEIPIHSVTLTSTTFFYFPSLPIDNQLCTVVVETTLPKSLYDYTLPDIKFLANVSHKHFTVHFNPHKRSVDQDYTHSSVLLLPLTILFMLALYNYNMIQASSKPYTDKFVKQALVYLRHLQQKTTSPTGSDIDSGADVSSSKKKPKARKT